MTGSGSFLRLSAFAALALSLAACQAPGTGVRGAGLSRPSVQPNELIGRDESGVAAALGQPGRVRREADAQVWQYDGGTCVLDLFLYPQNGALRVVHLEARDNAGKRMESVLCIGRVQGNAATS